MFNEDSNTPKKYTELEALNRELAGWIMGFAIGITVGLLSGFLLSGCADVAHSDQDRLERARMECLTICLDAQNECAWALAASPCETFCHDDLRLSTSVPGQVCVDHHIWETWADCQLCIMGRTSCDFGDLGGPVCLSECSPLRQTDVDCR